MAVILPHIEDANLTNYIPPAGEYEFFADEAHYEDKVKEWGLRAKKEYWYKDRTHQRLVTIKGYQTFGDTSSNHTIIIEFQDGNLSCIHPAYLKEMQSSNFGKELKQEPEAEKAEPKAEAPVKPAEPAVETKAPAKPAKEKKEKTAKLVLPDDKVHFTGKVKQFALSWNHFNEENDEVVVIEDLRIDGDEPIEVGLAWCSHSKTLKKFELSPGDDLDFNGKIVKKSLPKGKDVEDEAFLLDVSVPYKINNPSKIVKK
ncbi:hypothetical protein LIT32_15745 [Bacillus sp. CMF21]|uniref:hypothetical protein n=1 Tax=Metabacillus dongyingensis TaxID=2874282 RepID=UPI001CBBDFAE|nr:hypothetical protein [Metabacillus dongyingensis]UAL50669.1 hypothetical protein K8L98_15660 [Metabacillus dongyingensis]USK26937.1 hypothetical protein LIT32_15745 [Bacillus sp. CMF21]